MADLASFGNSERDIEQALVALKKGSQLLKYNRKGKPKFRPFRLSPDATTLIWISHGREKNLKLSSVSRIIPGQRTAVFRRHLRPEKDYLSFSLVYKNGERTLDLICKDKAEVEIWFGGLKALTSPRQHTLRSKSNLYDLQDGVDFFPISRPFGVLEFTSSIARGRDSTDSLLHWPTSDVATECSNMQQRTSTSDGFRISVSSTPSCSSGGSGPDDIESLGDVYIWGEVWTDGASPNTLGCQVALMTDVLVPKPLESNVVLDVQQIASGVRHIALVTRQGEVFSWGEEYGGRLGHGIDKDFYHPHLVEFLSVQNVDFIACGEYHTCAISTSGDLFTWGDGAHNAGLLGHGSDVSHWIPKRVTGPLEGLQVLSIACGAWHSALATSNGKLFTFGDGTFGVLGHGDRKNVSYPKEVQSLSGLKTIKVACGVWHTAAIIEVMGHQGSNILSKKLFTWGDGDKYRLGHGNKETYLQPTCVSALIDYNFHQIACGHTLTVALDTSGFVFTMGSTIYGQLGNPLSDGKMPTKVQDKLVGEFVEEISCGAHHVAVLTSRSELYTWGRGANGRLGHGDIENRKSPTLVEGLKDRHVKNISCGSNFTSCICIHKWVSGSDQSVCSGCRQAFGFTRKRHNCYNCGLVHCHACSSKKALRAALAPTPGKPHRVCDACYSKLKATEIGSASTSNRKPTPPRQSLDGRERLDRGEVRSSRILMSSITEPVKFLEIWGNKIESRHDFSSIAQTPQSILEFKDVAFPCSLRPIHNTFKPTSVTSSPPRTPPANLRPASPYIRRPSPSRSSTLGFSRSMIENLRKSNELINQELSKLQNQIRSLKQKNDMQDMEIHKLKKNVKEATLLTTEESSKHRLAREFIKSMTDQLEEVTQHLPPDSPDSETLRSIHAQAEDFLRENIESEASCSILSNLESNQETGYDTPALDINGSKLQEHKIIDPVGVEPSQDSGSSLQESNRSSVSSIEAATTPQSLENGSQSPDSMKQGRETESQVIEQFESGVYVTLVIRPSGRKAFKRVRFSKRKFDAQQAEEWWNKNKDMVFRKYSSPATNPAARGSSSNTQPLVEDNSETS
ncbi:PH, RCC1 and FYVE domains-containing protein 1 isoform X1 [Neltuma alba]|uniref:PH, RCC1 and FYVE domains-containing protein 1 isoform X1 n=1 Tax=Neltuma alba TaxID=207710 RepID=UPI0010A39F72|nr:PH, RCC1 and FYVE domains-containing protein 1-like isoform X1 [Prosopis alba]XP_028785574.1 PH, RCC1 and FYVE domains-containing protein 1-like isoform X1 [Prosopis alba]XP_028785575.1 PH, RCC1 and FYVE domains-containing protein 1-like isoform X1 [Prosopis alba]XP_028785576.1 PH, RCC1 and FYVE domains-containing protein 1-like isoform X1 [Prosopis alba]